MAVNDLDLLGTTGWPHHARHNYRESQSGAEKAARSCLSAYVLEAAVGRADQPVPKADRPDYSRTAALAHGDRYLALRLVDALEQ